MKSNKEDQQKTRKKPVIQIKEQQVHEVLTSPNLKYDFLGKQPDQSLLQQMRATQINSVLQNIDNFLNSLNNSIRKQNDKESFQKLMLLLGSPGTGKTVSAKYILKQLQIKCKRNPKKYQSLNRIQMLLFNGNTTKKCDQITNQMNKILSISGKERLESTYRQYEVNRSGKFVISVVYIEQIDQIFKNNGETALQNFIDRFGDPYRVVNKIQQNQKDKKLIKQQISQYLLIGTSNIVNLQTILVKKVPHAKKLLKIIFSPYNHDCLCKILGERLEKIRQKMDLNIKIQDKLIRYIITKLSQNKNDDTRCVIQVVKQLLVYAERSPQVMKALQKGKQASFQVNLQTLFNITKIKNMITNSRVDLVKKLNLKQQLILVILYKQVKQKQALQVPYLQIVEEYKRMQKNMGVNSYQDVTTAINELQTYNCIKIRSNSAKNVSFSMQKNHSKLSVVLNMSLNDIQGALSSNPALAGHFQ